MNKAMVLIVDDDEAMWASTARLLRSAGYQVRTFHDTQQLFAHGRPEGPCGLVLDVQMPREISIQFQQKLHSIGVRVPIVFISGHGDIPISVEAMKNGAIDFLPNQPRLSFSRVRRADPQPALMPKSLQGEQAERLKAAFDPEAETRREG